MTTLLTNDDLYLFNEGSHLRLYEHLGAHIAESNGEKGVYFAVWAPNADKVWVMGDFNDWNPGDLEMSLRGDSGIWERFVPRVPQGSAYKFHIQSRLQGYEIDKSDPFAVHTETPPRNASKVWDISYEWGDAEWMGSRHTRNHVRAPVSIYELHLGSWRRTGPD